MVFRMVKQKVFPKPHDIHLNFQLSADDTAFTNNGTMIPILYNDDAMTASTYYANPQHASFAEDTQGGCYPESKVYSISAKLMLSLTKEAWNTDKVRNLRVHIIPINVAFLEDLTPKDDLSGETIESILELQHETTDRQTYPIYNSVKLAGTTLDVGSRQPGLTTNTNIEGITFDLQKLYDALQYYTIKGKLRSCIGGVITKDISLDPMRGTKPGKTSMTGNMQMKLKLAKGAKAINPYTFMGFIIYIPKQGIESQWGLPSDTTDLTEDHVNVDFRCRFNEWNDSFNFERA